MKKAFAIYRHSQYWGRPGMWERCGKYETPEATLQAMKDFTKQPKKLRVFRYIILPNLSKERWFLAKDHDKLYKAAR